MTNAWDIGRLLAGTAGIATLVCYVMCGVVANKTRAVGGGTRVLSWIGLCIPCIAWIVLYQEWSAVKAYAAAQPNATSESIRRSFNGWLVAYIVFAVIASVLGKTYGRG